MNVVIWARVSSREQAEGYSLDAQIRINRDKAAREGWTVIREFVIAESARRGAERIAFNEMYQWVKKNAKRLQIEAVLAHKLDRICRNMRDAVRMQELALAEYALVKRSVDNAASVARPEYLAASEKFKAFADAMSDHATTDAERERATEWRRRATELRQFADNPKAPELTSIDADPIAGVSESARWIWTERERRSV